MTTAALQRATGSEGLSHYLRTGRNQSDKEASLVYLEYKKKRMAAEAPELQHWVEDNVLTTPDYGRVHDNSPQFTLIECRMKRQRMRVGAAGLAPAISRAYGLASLQMYKGDVSLITREPLLNLG